MKMVPGRRADTHARGPGIPGIHGYLVERQYTIDDVRAAKPRMIFYGANTCWWTHLERDLSLTSSAEIEIDGRMVRIDPLPCDPCGGMLLQTYDIEGFLRAAEASAAHYGKHGLRAFEAAHHGNVVISREDQRPTCFESWADYNRVIDEGGLDGSRPLE